MGLEDGFDSSVKAFEFCENFLLAGIDIFDALSGIILRTLKGDHELTLFLAADHAKWSLAEPSRGPLNGPVDRVSQANEGSAWLVGLREREGPKSGQAD